MNIRNYALSFYSNTLEGIHIQRVEKPREAKEIHTHEYYQIYYILKGRLTHYIEDDISVLSAGDLFIITPGTAHRIEENGDTVFYSLSFMPEVIDSMDRSAEVAIDFLNSLKNEKRIRPKITVPSDEVLHFETIIERIYREFEEHRIIGYDIIRLYIILLLTLFARIYYDFSDAPPSLSAANDRNKLILYCVDYIEHNYFRSISLDEIVRISMLSKSEFCRSFREITGYSFHNYLNYCRIKKAAEMIKRGDKITALYTFCGFEDFSTFYRNFKKTMGISPAQYKNINL